MDQHRHLQAHEIIRRHAGYRRRLRWHIGERPALHRRDELLWVLRQQNLAIARIATPLLGPDRQQIGRAHVLTPVTNAHLVCRLLLEKKKLLPHRFPTTISPPLHMSCTLAPYLYTFHHYLCSL